MNQKIIDPWGSELLEDYEKIIKDFGLEAFNPKLFPKPNRIMRRGVVFAGRDLNIISDAIKKKKKFYRFLHLTLRKIKKVTIYTSVVPQKKKRNILKYPMKLMVNTLLLTA